MKSILITGATDGIGFEAAKLFAAQGHHVIIHGRNEQKLQASAAELNKVIANAKVECICADFSSFDGISSFIKSVKTNYKQLDIIINNAGVFKTNDAVTDAGFDVRFVVNTIAPFAISTRLLALLTAKGRIVNLSSAAQAPVNLAALAGQVTIFDDFQAYAQSKLALTVWSQELAKQLTSEQVMVAINPGSLLASKMVQEGFNVQGNDLSIGANILLEAALSGRFSKASGKYFDNDVGQFSNPHSSAADNTFCQQLMDVLTDTIERQIKH